MIFSEIPYLVSPFFTLFFLGESLAAAKQLKSTCEKYRVPFVINDNVEVALACDADGVHVGQSDIKDRDIRAIIGEDKILGMIARTVEQAQAAEKACAGGAGQESEESSLWRGCLRKNKTIAGG